MTVTLRFVCRRRKTDHITMIIYTCANKVSQSVNHNNFPELRGLPMHDSSNWLHNCSVYIQYYFIVYFILLNRTFICQDRQLSSFTNHTEPYRIIYWNLQRLRQRLFLSFRSSGMEHSPKESSSNKKTHLRSINPSVTDHATHPRQHFSIHSDRDMTDSVWLISAARI